MSNINNVFRGSIVREMRAAIRTRAQLTVVADDDSPNAPIAIIKLRLVHNIPAEGPTSDHWRLEWVDRHLVRYTAYLAGKEQTSQFDVADQVVDYCLGSVGDMTRIRFSHDGTGTSWLSAEDADTNDMVHEPGGIDAATYGR